MAGSLVQIDRYEDGLEIRLEGRWPGTRALLGSAAAAVLLGPALFSIGASPRTMSSGLFDAETTFVGVTIFLLYAAAAGLAGGILQTMRPVHIIEVSDGRLRVRPSGKAVSFDAPVAEVTATVAQGTLHLVCGDDTYAVNARSHLTSSLMEAVEALDTA